MWRPGAAHQGAGRLVRPVSGGAVPPPTHPPHLLPRLLPHHYISGPALNIPSHPGPTRLPEVWPSGDRRGIAPGGGLGGGFRLEGFLQGPDGNCREKAIQRGRCSGRGSGAIMTLSRSARVGSNILGVAEWSR